MFLFLNLFFYIKRMEWKWRRTWEEKKKKSRPQVVKRFEKNIISLLESRLKNAPQSGDRRPWRPTIWNGWSIMREAPFISFLCLYSKTHVKRTKLQQHKSNTKSEDGHRSGIAQLASVERALIFISEVKVLSSTLSFSKSLGLFCIKRN